MINDGIKWCVADGKKVSILGEPWLSCANNSFVGSDHMGLRRSFVCSLMKTCMREWDEDVVNDMFDTRERNLILGIPLSMEADEDSYQWSKEKTWVYTVKSAYNLIQVSQGR